MLWPSWSTGWSPPIAEPRSTRPACSHSSRCRASVVPANQVADDRGQQDAEESRHQAAGECRRGGALHLGQPLRAQVRFFLSHHRELSADGIHFDLAAIGRDHRQRRFQSLCPAQLDGRLELGQLGGNALLERLDPGLLCGVVARQLGDLVQPQGNRRQGRGVGVQVPLVVGEQEATLSGFGVLNARQQFVERDDDFVGMDDLLVVFLQCLQVPIGNESGEQEEEEDAGKAEGDDPGPARTCG